MTDTAIPITTEGTFIPASVCAAIRRVLMADLAACRRDRIPVAPEIVDSVQTIDNIGAWFENKKVPQAETSATGRTLGEQAPMVSSVAPVGFAQVDCSYMTTASAAIELKVSQQFVRRLLKDGVLAGWQQPDRSWRVSSASVAARKEPPR